VSASVLYMSMSLDGFIAGPNEGPGNGLGDGGLRLHEWGSEGVEPDPNGVFGRSAGVNGTVVDEMLATGAVVAGRVTFELADGWDGDHHDGVPIFILTRHAPDSGTGRWPLVTYVTDVRTAMAEAKRAAGDRNVLVHGVGTARLALAAGVLDELEIHLVPVLLGQGRRLFDERGPAHIELERTRVLEGETGVTHMHYRVRDRREVRHGS
jgi:dihydrofolate reductase